jgi:hypothetical protein
LVDAFPVMFSAFDCHDDASIGPLTFLMVAPASVNLTSPKFARLAMVPPTGGYSGASTIHSAQYRWAWGLYVLAELTSLMNDSFWV